MKVAFGLRKLCNLSQKDHPKHTRLQKRNMMQVKERIQRSIKADNFRTTWKECVIVYKVTLFSIFFPSSPGFSFHLSSLIENISIHYSLSWKWIERKVLAGFISVPAETAGELFITLQWDTAWNTEGEGSAFQVPLEASKEKEQHCSWRGAETGSLSSDRSGLIWVYYKTQKWAWPHIPALLCPCCHTRSGINGKGLEFASELKETKDISVCPLLLYFSLLSIISSVKQDQNSSLLYLQVLLWLCSSSTAEGHMKCC